MGTTRGGQALAAHFQLQFGAVGGMGGLDVGHGDRVAERGREAAAGHGADQLVAGETSAPFARGHAAFEREADAAGSALPFIQQRLQDRVVHRESRRSRGAPC